MKEAFLNTGLFITVVGILIVFMVLILLNIFFSIMPTLLEKLEKPRLTKAQKEEPKQQKQIIEAEVLAAISAALVSYFNTQHDKESQELTIKTISKRYSPWSSKIYQMNNLNKPYY